MSPTGDESVPGSGTVSRATVLDRPLPAARKRVSSFVQLHTLTKAMLRGFFRDRAAMFFTFFFPLMFIVVFGLIFRGGTPSITIGVVGAGLRRVP